MYHELALIRGSTESRSVESTAADKKTVAKKKTAVKKADEATQAGGGFTS